MIKGLHPLTPALVNSPIQVLTMLTMLTGVNMLHVLCKNCNTRHPLGSCPGQGGSAHLQNPLVKDISPRRARKPQKALPAPKPVQPQVIEHEALEIAAAPAKGRPERLEYMREYMRQKRAELAKKVGQKVGQKKKPKKKG